MIKPLKLKDLYEIVRHEIDKGNANKTVMLSNDDEGNGYHYLFYGMTLGKDMVDDDMFAMCVEEDVAPMDETIVLG